jgi:Family of unknown function (DUF5336)
MTYSPGGPGYPPVQQHGPYAPTTQFGKVDEGPSKLPMYLLAAVVAFGLAGYLVSFGPVWKSSEIGPVAGTNWTGGSLEVVAMLLAALLAAVGLLPKQRNYLPLISVIAVVGFLLAVSELITKPSFLSVGWALIVIVVLAGLQAVVAVGALLLEAGVITPPQPRPKYDQYQPYGAPPVGQYYGQPGQPQQHTPQPQQNFSQQRPGYPQYGGYPAAGTGGYPPPGPAGGPPTPPTGFPTYAQPPTQAIPAPTQAMPSPAQAQQPQGSSAQSGPAQS